MAQIQIILQLLVENLERKIDIYTRLIRLTEAQSVVFMNQEADGEKSKELFGEKQQLIEEVKVLDEAFEASYGRIKTVITQEGSLYAEQIKLLQNKINQVMLLSLKIKASEASNKTTLQKDSLSEPVKQAANRPISTAGLLRKDRLLNQEKK